MFKILFHKQTQEKSIAKSEIVLLSVWIYLQNAYIFSFATISPQGTTLVGDFTQDVFVVIPFFVLPIFCLETVLKADRILYLCFINIWRFTRSPVF